MKKAILLLSLLALCLPSFALEIREGRLKLLLNESTGRFSLYYLTDLQKDKYEPLFMDKDPRTSFLSILVDDRAQRLGDSASFKVSADRIDGGAKLSFDSSNLLVVENFTFARSAEATLSDVVRIEIGVSNKSDRELNVGIRLVLDTNLGEKVPEHFRTDLKGIDSEIFISRQSDLDAFWISSNEKYGLMGNIASVIPGVAAPDGIHFANWKRLNDASWKSTVGKGRNFNLLPYSIGDSALSYYFDPAPIARGAERKATVFLGVANPKGFAGLGSSAASEGLSQLMRKSVQDAGSQEYSAQTDLVTVRDLLGRVDAVLNSKTAVSQEELAALESIIARLKERNASK